MAQMVFRHILDADEVTGICTGNKTSQPLVKWENGKRTNQPVTNDQGQAMHKITGVDVRIGDETYEATIQAAQEQEFEAGAVLRPVSDVELRVRGRSQEKTTFAEVVVTVVAEAWETDGNVYDALASMNSTSASKTSSSSYSSDDAV